MSEVTELKTLNDLVEVIKKDIGKLLGANITVAIVNAKAEIKFIDKPLSKFSDFIISFTKGNFELLSIGDHSLPLSGTNIAFFKISEKSLIILNSDKGPVGQLLAFKGRMSKYAPQIDTLIEAVVEKKKKKAPTKAAVRVPVLIQSISSKKFGMEEAKVLHLVNGENTITDICDKTELPQLRVDEILRKYQKKGWIKLKRLIIGVQKETPEPPAKKPDVKPVKPTAIPPPTPTVSKDRKESVYLFPILEDPFKPKKYSKTEAKVLKYCDGQYTIGDIVKETSMNQLKVMEIIKKYEKKGKLTITKILPPASTPEAPPAAPAPPPPEPPAPAPESPPTTPLPPEPVQPAVSPQPTIPAPPPQTPEAESEDAIFDDLMDIMETTQPIEQPTPQPQNVSPPPLQPATPITPVSPPAPSTSSLPPANFSPPPAQTPPPTTPVSAPPGVAPQSTPVAAEIEGEPVSDSMFDNLKSLLDETSPMTQGQPASPAPAQPVTPTTSSPEPTANTPMVPNTISSEGLLEETDEGIKITTYPEQDPLQSRLKRLSNILEDTTEETPIKEEKEGVQIVGSKAICPECKTHVTMMAKICPNCERPLRICPNCNSPITLFARICPACGSLL